MFRDRIASVNPALHDGRYISVVAAVGANFTQLSARLVLSPLVPFVIAAFGISKSEVGLALTIMWMMYAILQFPSGVLSDRYGERTVILVALGALSGGSLLLAWSPSFIGFVAAVVLLGTSAGLYFTAGASLLTRTFENTGRVLGFHTSGSAVGGLVAPVVAVFIAARFGWRAATLFGFVLAVPVMVTFLVAIEPMPPLAPDVRIRDRLNLDLFRVLFRDPAITFTTLLGGIGSFAFQAFASFFPTFLVEYGEFSAEFASVVFSMVFLLGALALPVLGGFSDTYARDLILLVPLGGLLVGFVALLATDALVVVVVATALLGVGLAWGGIVQARLMDILDSDDQGAGFGLIRSLYVFMGAFGSVVTGTLADTYGWSVAYGFVIVLLGIAILAILGNRLFDLSL